MEENAVNPEQTLKKEKKSLDPRIAFALMVLCLFLPFERIEAQKGGEAVATSTLNGWALISASGNVALENGASAPVKRLTDEAGPVRDNPGPQVFRG